MQLHGDASYIDEPPISRQYTGTRISTIYASTSEVMETISRNCLGNDSLSFNTRNF